MLLKGNVLLRDSIFPKKSKRSLESKSLAREMNWDEEGILLPISGKSSAITLPSCRILLINKLIKSFFVEKGRLVLSSSSVLFTLRREHHSTLMAYPLDGIIQKVQLFYNQITCFRRISS